MGQPWEVTYRKYGIEYHKEILSDFGGWDADSTDATLGRGDFSEVRNFRRPTSGDFEVRTGQSTTPLQNSANAIVLAKCEYRNDWLNAGVVQDTFFDVTLFEVTTATPGSVYIALYEPISGTQVTIPVQAPLINPPSPIPAPQDPPEAWVVQYAWSLIVTIKGFGSWEVAPTSNTLAAWTATSLGKDVCPTPAAIDFVSKTSGDLFAIDNSGYDPTNPGKLSFAANIKRDPNDPPNPLLIPIPIDCDYWLNMVGVFAINGPRFWVHGSPDVNADKPEDVNAVLHTISRAWGYRFVAVQEFTNSKGEKYRIRTAPSVDVWVPDVTYGPAQWGGQPQYFVGYALGHYVGGPTVSSDNLWTCLVCAPWTGAYDLGTTGVNIAGVTIKAIPSAQDLENLRLKYVSFGGGASSWTPIVNPYRWLSDYLGWQGNAFGGNDPNTTNNLRHDGQAPYLVDVPASKLKKAPMTIFDWAQFVLTGLAGITVEIEVYRTAHSQPQDKDNTAKDPNFEAHKYGYVGSVLPNGTLTDTVVDDAIDFGTTPEQQDGYLRGQFSGAITREFDNRLVIGDIATDYKVLPPAVLALKSVGPTTINGVAYTYDDSRGTIQAFSFKVDLQTPSTSYTASNIWGTHGASSDKNIHFYACYQDVNGTASDPVEITNIIPGGVEVSGTMMWVSFACPRGYAANIDAVILYRSLWNGTDYDTTKIATVKCTNGYYTSKNDEVGTLGHNASPSALIPKGVTKRSTAPGSIIFSEPNQIYFWPPLNFEIHHQFAHVRLLDVVLGPLYVGTDQSISLTELNGRREELTKHIGPISRFGIQKVDKIIFFLSPYGMYFVESSGVVQFPAQVQTAILPYLNEVIANQLPLTTAKKVTLGFLGERNELWLHLPSSTPAGTLPHRTIIFKLGPGNNPAHAINYEFDLREDFERRDIDLVTVNNIIPDDTSRYRNEQIIFQSRAMGGLIAGFFDKTPQQLVSVNCDVPAIAWQGSAAIEKSWHAGMPNTLKSLREVIWRTSGSGKLSLSTGQPNAGGWRSHLRGAISIFARIFPVVNMIQPLKHITSGSSVEIRAGAPYTRLYSEPDANGAHDLHVKSVELMAEVTGNHP